MPDVVVFWVASWEVLGKHDTLSLLERSTNSISALAVELVVMAEARSVEV